LGWLAAATLAGLLTASATAAGLWLGARAGTGTAPDALLLDLPPIKALAEPPPAPPAPAPKAPAAAPADMAPPPQPTAAPAPELTPPPALAPASSAGADQPQADTPPDTPADTTPAKPKAAKSKAKAQKQATSAKPASAPAPAATAQGDGATASAMQKWLSKAQKTLGRHMSRKSYGGTGQVTLLFSVAASGQITAASLQGTTTDPALDAAILAQARRAPALPPRPDGKAGRLALPVRLRG
jgi:TonB family protein